MEICTETVNALADVPLADTSTPLTDDEQILLQRMMRAYVKEETPQE
jgi:hypothetical protein